MRYCRLSIACEIIAFVSGLLCVIIGAVILGIFAKLYHKAVEEVCYCATQ